MEILINLNERVKRFSLLDVKLSQFVAMFAVLIVVKFFPQIIDLNVWWFVVLLIICAIRPVYVFLFKK
jgi:hypothetical protein